jgi:hypothetical protein
MQDQTSTNYVGLEDVRQALLDMGNVSPFNTNAGKVRDKIDRGSNGTIQKHLIFLRNQIIAAAQPQAEQSVPKPPQDAVEMLWAAAWGAAQTKTLARLESLSAERDGLRATTIAQTADLEAFTEQLDALASQVQEHVSAAERVHAVEIQKTATAAAQSAAQTQALAALQAELARVTEASDHAAELAIRDAQIERQALQSIIDRQSDQLGELKALRITAQAHDESLANVQAAALATAEKTQANMQIQAAALATAQAEIVRIREAATHAAELANLASEKDRQNLLSIIEQMKLSPKDGK